MFYVQSSLKFASSAVSSTGSWIRYNSTYANAVTFLGIFLTWEMAVLRYYGEAGVCTFLLMLGVVITDKLDGLLARHLNQTTAVGSVIDKLRDKMAAISHGTFMYLSYTVTQKSFSPVILVEIIIIGCFETTLLVIGSMACICGKKLRANRFGEIKMGFEYGAGILWAIFNDLKPFGIGIENETVLLTMSLSLLLTIILAYKSIEGQFKEHLPLIKKVASIIRNY
jgi:phosphatidylglycerophosphate synthase